MTENEIARTIVDAALTVHRELGPGLLESVYEAVLAYELGQRGLRVRRQVPVPIQYGNVRFDEGFRADLIVEERVIVELKSVEKPAPVHKKQTLTYVRLADLRLGLLINFGEVLLKNGITRLVNRQGAHRQRKGQKAGARGQTGTKGPAGQGKGAAVIFALHRDPQTRCLRWSGQDYSADAPDTKGATGRNCLHCHIGWNRRYRNSARDHQVLIPRVRHA